MLVLYPRKSNKIKRRPKVQKAKKKRWSLRKKYTLIVMMLALIPLLISYIIFIRDKIRDSEINIKANIKEVADQVAASKLVQDILERQENNGSLQVYAEELMKEMRDVDLIVIADQTGEKYSHPDKGQVGEIFVGEDKIKVLEEGISYYSLKEGSMGSSLRYFRPIFQGNRQVGFVMVGKYEEQIIKANDQILKEYILLLAIVLLGIFISGGYFSFRLKKVILDMEPEEIAALYLQKESLLNSVQEGIILLNSTHEVKEENERAKQLLAYLPINSVIESLSNTLENKQEVRMQEFIIEHKKLLISTKPLIKENLYLGAVITLMDKEEIHQVAKEMMGIEEKNKNLRAIVHEFKNQLHVLLGLLQLEEYEEAKDYILEIQKIKTHRTQKFDNIRDPYVRAMLISRAIMAEEKQVKMELTEVSSLMESHDCIDENDLITILGNLIENAFEACSISHQKEKLVKVHLEEDKQKIQIQISDNGEAIDEKLKSHLLELGVSSKGEGRGHGLYLVKKRIDIYNGEIQIKEKEGEKVFYITLPKGAENE